MSRTIQYSFISSLRAASAPLRRPSVSHPSACVVVQRVLRLRVREKFAVNTVLLVFNIRLISLYSSWKYMLSYNHACLFYNQKTLTVKFVYKGVAKMSSYW